MTLNVKIGGFMDFLAILVCDTSLYNSQSGARYYRYRYRYRYGKFGICILT